MVTAKPDEALNLQRYLEIGLRRWWLIALIPTVAVVLVFLWSRSQAPIYEASVTLLLQQGGTGSSGGPTLGEMQASERLAATYRELITTKPVLEDLAVELNLNANPQQIRGKVSSTVIRDTRLLRVSVRDRDPQLAAEMASTLADVFIRRQQEDRLTAIARLQAAAAARGIIDQGALLEAQLASIGSISVVDPPSIPSVPVLPRTTTNMIVTTILGLLFGVLFAFVLEYFNDKLRTLEEFDEPFEAFRITRLGTVPRWRSVDVGLHAPAVQGASASPLSETYRQFRTNVSFAVAPYPQAKVIVVTSSLPGEGKSTTTVNLGLALAQAGSEVVLMDADLRKPDLHKWFQGLRDFGLSNALADHTVNVDQILQQTAHEGVRLIPAGPLPPNPAELLGLPRLREIITELKQRADYIVVDSPPMLPVADTSEIMKAADAAILVVRANATGRRTLRECILAIQKTGIPVLGALVNAHNRSRFGLGYGGRSYSYRYGYGYGYGYGAATNGRSGLFGELKHDLLRRISGRPQRRSSKSGARSDTRPEQ